MSRPVTDPYRRTQAALAQEVSTRALERDALMRITRGIQEARDSGDRMALVRAVSQNQTLWMIFITDVLNEGNRLPADLRKLIASVGMAVVQEMSENMHGDLDVDFLIDINRNFIEGLSSNAG